MAFNLSAAINLQPINVSQASKSINSLNKVMDGAEKKARSFSDVVSFKATNFAAYAVASSAVLKLTNAISRATTEAIKLEKELVKISQVIRVSVDESRALSGAILDISKNYGISSIKVAETVRTLTQSGLAFDKARKAAELLAKTTLLATFDSLQSTTEGLIAIFAQFNVSVKEAETAIGSINALSKRYAVESGDLIEAVKRAGGVFAATGGRLEDLLAIFTTVRSTTRESAETIATGLRTIFSRLQRPKTIEYFRELGIELTNLNGQFVGNLPAIQKISTGIEKLGIRAGDVKFAEIVEQLGGIRQAARVIPLLTQQAKLAQTVAVANKGLIETDEDVAKAKQTLAFRIDELRAKFGALVVEISESTSFKLLTNTMLSLADSLIDVASALKPLLPLITAFAGIKIGQTIGKTIRGFSGGKNVLGFNRGGVVPGSGNGDTVPSMLEPGEFVIRKSAVQAFGADKLASINKYANGGRAFKPRSLNDENKLKYERGAKLSDGSLQQASVTYKDLDNVGLEKPVAAGVKGALYEKYMREKFGIVAPQEGRPEFPDVSPSKALRLTKAAGIPGQIDGKKLDGAELKYRLTKDTVFNYRKRLREQESPKNIPMIFAEGQKFAKGGAVGTDTVPALLTPGEFVINKKSAQAAGYSNLQKINKYAKGGIVGPQKFADGGEVGPSITDSLSTASVQFAIIFPLLKEFGNSIKKMQNGIEKFNKSNQKAVLIRDKLNNRLSNLETKRSKAEAGKVAPLGRIQKLGAQLDQAKSLPQTSGTKQLVANLEASLQKSIVAVNNFQSEIDETTSKINQTQKQIKATGGVGRLGRKAGKVLSKVDPLAVVGVAATALTATLSGIESTFKNLKNQAIENKDVNEALAAASQEAAAGLNKDLILGAAATGAALGSLAGPFGTLIGGLAGATAGIVTSGAGIAKGVADFGISALNYVGIFGEIEKYAEKEIRLRKEAAEAIEASKITDSLSNIGSKFNNLSRDIDPKKNFGDFASQANELAKQTQQAISTVNTVSDPKEKERLLTDASEEAEAALRSLAEAGASQGMSFDQISAAAPALVDAYRASLNALNPAEAESQMNAFVNTTNAQATAAREEAVARKRANAVFLEQIAIQDRLNASLLIFEQSLKVQEAALSNLDFALTGKLGSSSVGSNLTDFSKAGTAEFNTGLSEIAKLGPDFAREANKIKKGISSFDGFAEALAGQNKDQVANGIIDKLKNILTPTQIEDIRKKITDFSGTGTEAAVFEKELINEFIGPFADTLESGREVINKSIQNYADILDKRNELEKRSLETRLGIIQQEQDIFKQISELSGNDLTASGARSRSAELASASLRGTGLESLITGNRSLAVSNLGSELSSRRSRSQQLQQQISANQGQLSADQIKSITKEFKKLESESQKLEKAMEFLSDTTEENATIQKKLDESRAERQARRDAATSLAFGTQESRSTFFKNLKAAQIVGKTGSAESIPESQRGDVLSILQQFSKSRSFGGRTGQETINAATARYLANIGVPLDEIGNVMDDFIAGELDMISAIRQNLRVDLDRNKILERIEKSQASGFATGGLVYAAGGSLVDFQKKGTDTVPAMLTPGEFVIKRSSVKKYGTGMMEQINAGNFANGGLIGSSNSRFPSLSENDLDKKLQRRINEIENSGLDEDEKLLWKTRLYEDEAIRLRVNRSVRPLEIDTEQKRRKSDLLIKSRQAMIPTVEDLLGPILFQASETSMQKRINAALEYVREDKQKRYEGKISSFRSKNGSLITIHHYNDGETSEFGFLTTPENRREGAARGLARRSRSIDPSETRLRAGQEDPTNLTSRVRGGSDKNRRAFELGMSFSDNGRFRSSDRIDREITAAKKRIDLAAEAAYNNRSLMEEFDSQNPKESRKKFGLNPSSEIAQKKLMQNKNKNKKKDIKAPGIDFSKPFSVIPKQLVYSPDAVRKIFLNAATTKGRHLKDVFRFSTDIYSKLEKADLDGDGFVDALELNKYNPQNYKNIIEMMYDAVPFSDEYRQYTSKLYGLKSDGKFDESIITGFLKQGNAIFPQFNRSANPNKIKDLLDNQKTGVRTNIDNLLKLAKTKGTIAYIVNKLSNGQLISNIEDTYTGLQKFNTGGFVGGKPGIDQNPAMLSRGEFVMQKSAVDKYGTSTMQRINQGKAGKFANGGVVSTGSQTDSFSFIDPQQLELIKQSFTPFIDAVNNLIAMPKEIEVTMAPVSVSVNHNGLEIFSTIKEETQKMIMKHVSETFVKLIDGVYSGDLQSIRSQL